jgi:hypothetical protein
MHKNEAQLDFPRFILHINLLTSISRRITRLLPKPGRAMEIEDTESLKKDQISSCKATFSRSLMADCRRFTSSRDLSAASMLDTGEEFSRQSRRFATGSVPVDHPPAVSMRDCGHPALLGYR